MGDFQHGQGHAQRTRTDYANHHAAEEGRRHHGVADDAPVEPPIDEACDAKAEDHAERRGFRRRGIAAVDAAHDEEDEYGLRYSSLVLMNSDL